MTNVGIYVFDDVEVVDFAGPFEVFSTASRVHARTCGTDEHPIFEVLLISDEPRLAEARGGFPIQTRQSLRDHRPLDVLVVPGGNVSAELRRTQVIQ